MADAKAISRLYNTRQIVEALLPYVHGDVIDFGAGLSRYKPMILTKAKSYKAMDSFEAPGIDVVADVMNPPLADSSCDTVLCTQVLEHIREPWIVVEHIARVLRPGGTAIVTTPFMYPYHPDPGDYFRYTADGLASLFERVGMKVELKGGYCGFFGVLSETIKQKFLSHYGKPRSWFKRRLLFVIERIAAFLNRIAPPGIVYANSVCIARKP